MFNRASPKVLLILRAVFCGMIYIDKLLKGQVFVVTNEIEKILSDVLNEHTQRRTEDGRWSTELCLDYNDRELEESIIKTIAASDDPRGYFYETTSEAFQDSIWQVEGELVKAAEDALDEAGMDYASDYVREYIQEHVDINVPVDEILEHNSVCVNIIVDTGDANYDFAKNSFAHSYYGGEGIEDESSLLWLAKQQGATEDDLRRAFNEGTAFSPETLQVVQAREEVLKVLESYGKRDAFGYEINRGQYAEAKRIEKELRGYMRDKAMHEKTLADLPKTFEDYNDLCNERGLRSRFDTAGAFEKKRDEIADFSKNRVSELEAKIASLNKDIDDKDLKPVFEAMDNFKELTNKFTEIAYTEEYKKARMLDSLIECSASTTSGLNALTFCVQMPLSQYLDLREAMQREEHLNNSSYPEERKGTGEIVLSSKTHAILYDSWNGAGSCSDIELCSDVVLPINLIHSATPDGMNGYGIKEIYGTNEEFFSDTLKEIKPMVEKPLEKSSDRKPGLDDVIASAEAAKNAALKAEENPLYDKEKEN